MIAVAIRKSDVISHARPSLDRVTTGDSTAARIQEAVRGDGRGLFTTEHRVVRTRRTVAVEDVAFYLSSDLSVEALLSSAARLALQESVMVTTIASRPPMHSAAAALELAGPATCPSCHAADLTMTDNAVATGANWRCRRCGQLWDAGRLAAVAAYAVWLSER
jgi:hypothetical protein